MASSSSSFVNELAKGINKMLYKNRYNKKNCKTCRIKYKDCGCWLEYSNITDILIEYRCLCYNKNCQNIFDGNLERGSANIYINVLTMITKFILLLQNHIYPCEYMNRWDKFNEILLLRKEDSYSHSDMENILDVDYKHSKRVCKDFRIKNLGEHRDLSV